MQSHSRGPVGWAAAGVLLVAGLLASGVRLRLLLGGAAAALPRSLHGSRGCFCFQLQVALLQLRDLRFQGVLI